MREYIAPLDGLRAIAIALVFIFHLDETYLPGGFIGVDIFFTISGYIISRIIIQSLSDGGFNLLTFYHRRINRLVPAVIATVITSVILAFFIYNTLQVSEFARSGIYSIMSVANICFWLNSGYFDDTSQGNIFLHTWSLSVEEQFYLLWPALITLLWRTSRLSIPTVLLITLISLIFAWLLAEYEPSAAFYLMPARIFQFSLGTLVAVLHSKVFLPKSLSSSSSNYISNAAFLLGIICIFLSASMANGYHYRFWIAALLPVLGASLILLTINSGFSFLVLGGRAIRTIGIRAYSLYLVHWPIIVMSGIVLGSSRPFMINVLIAIGCILAAELLHRLVEKPFRLKGKSNFSGNDRLRTASVFVALPISLVLLAHLWVYSSQNIEENPFISVKKMLNAEKGRISNTVSQDLTTYVKGVDNLWKDRARMGRVDIGCQLSNDGSYSDFKEAKCVPTVGAKNKILILGDSYAPETLIMLSRIFPEDRLMMVGSAGCPPIYPEPNWGNRKSGCRELNIARFNWVLRDDVSAVVLTSNWQIWNIKTLETTIQYLVEARKPIILMGARPNFTDRVPMLLGSSIGQTAAQDLKPYLKYDMYGARSMIQQAVKQAGELVWHIDLTEYLCGNDCKAFTSTGDLIYLDNAHISSAAALAVGNRIESDIGNDLRAHVNRANNNIATFSQIH